MTDRLKGLVVTFENDIREDDVEHIVAAIALIRGVVGVQPVKGDFNDQINRQRIRHELARKLYEALR